MQPILQLVVNMKPCYQASICTEPQRYQAIISRNKQQWYASSLDCCQPKYKHLTREQFTAATGMMLRLDASKARSCPDGISVIVVVTESTLTMQVTPRVIAEAFRRGWPGWHRWMASCIQNQNVQPLEEFSIKTRNLLLRDEPKLALSSQQYIMIINRITLTVLKFDYSSGFAKSQKILSHFHFLRRKSAI